MFPKTAEKLLRKAHDLAEQHGARIERVGAVWHVRGPTIDVKLADLAFLQPQDFRNGAPKQHSES